ncbi:MAG: hypothetical protein HY349_03075 [Nitrospirae bacterium]|nr:hypothetical protein [Nitrospirota bacterium]
MKSKNLLKNERGLALVVALMLLVLLTVMGLAAISTTTTEMQITSNERTDAQAFHAAEAGIKEVLYRTALSSVGATSIANGGSYATVDAVTFNAAIGDLGIGDNPDPDWEVNVYFGTPPAGANNVRSILPAADQAKLNYGKNAQGNPDPVNVRYVTEADLQQWGLVNADLNNDGDFIDLVYYNGDANDPQRVPPSTAVGGTIDTAPPTGSNMNMAVRLVTARGHSGLAAKRIRLETTGYPVNPQVSAALTADIPLTLTGSGFISGYNHSEDTANTNADKNSINRPLYETNLCDNYNGGAGTGGCGMATDPDVGATAEYSGKAMSSGHKPAVVSNDPVTTQGAFEGWGGSDDNSVGWKKVDPAVTFPSLAALLGVEQSAVDEMIAGANTNPNACPSGVTYIDNKNSNQNYMPAQNCPAGSGILIVTGDMKITAQFEFRGLVYVEKDAELRGGSWILGALAIKGTSTLKSNAGSSTVLYSKKTVENVVKSAMSNAALPSNVLSWRED